jgi:hypothetical protein
MISLAFCHHFCLRSHLPPGSFLPPSPYPVRSLSGFAGIYFGGFTYYRSNQPGADPSFWNNMHAQEFWAEIPALVKDGAAFLQSGGATQGHFSQYAAVDDVEAGASSAPKKKTNAPAKRKVALPPKKSGGNPPARKSAASEEAEDGEAEDDQEEFD